MQLLAMWEYAAWVELGKLFFFEDCIGAQRYVAILREPNLFGAQWGKLLT
jgi:hypothetical protein